MLQTWLLEEVSVKMMERRQKEWILSLKIYSVFFFYMS